MFSDPFMGLVQKPPISLLPPYTNQKLRVTQKIDAERDWCRNSRFPVFATLRLHTALGQDQQTLEELTAPLELPLMNTGLTDHDAGLSDYNCWNTHLEQARVTGPPRAGARGWKLLFPRGKLNLV